MKSSSVSTSKWFCNKWLGIFALAAGLAAAGCGQQENRGALPPRHGYADLNTLVRRHPGWNGLAQYDAAVARLDSAASSLPLAGQPNQKMATLPALLLTGQPESLVLPARESHLIAQRLNSVQQSLVEGLQDRRETARADQIRRQQELWRREARLKYPAPVRTAEISMDLELQLLQANVLTLTRTLTNWRQSPPPAPRLDTLKAKVEADRARLVALIAERLQARANARTARLAAAQRVRDQRTAYVQTQAADLSARLEADDVRLYAAQRDRLTAQRLALLDALARPEALFVPTVGAAGSLSLPQGPGAARAVLSAASLTEARRRLLTQRGRWVQYLYDDTRATALDLAARRNWTVSFGPPRRGDWNMTPDLAQAMDNARGLQTTCGQTRRVGKPAQIG